MKPKTNSFSHAIYFIKQYGKRYGLTKLLRALIHYTFRLSKKGITKKNVLEVNGYKLSLIPNDLGISSELSTFKMHEPITTHIITKNLKRGMTCVDIGANIGYFALLESKIVGPSGKVIAIEPSPLNFQQLQKNIKLQNFNNFEAFNFAAGNENTTTRFFQNDRSNGSQTLIGNQPPPNRSGKVITVPVRIIDDFVNELNPSKINFIRMDVEGYEFEIFQGMKKTLKKFKPLIQIEVHKGIMGKDKTRDFLLMLQQYGYETITFHLRDLDVPFIGTKTDIHNKTISDVLEMVDQNKLASFFNVTLKPKDKL